MESAGERVWRTMQTLRRSASGAATRTAASSATTPPKSRKAWSCSTPFTASRPTQAHDLACRWNCKAGKCGSCSAEINGKPQLMCMTRLDDLPLGRADHRRADAGVPADQGSRHRRVVELRGEEEDQAVQAAQARRAGRHVADAAGRRRSRAGVPQVHRVLPVPGRVPRAARSPQARRVHRPAVPRLRGGAGDAPARHRGPHRRAEREARHRLLQHHEVLHEGVPGAHHDHRQRDHPAEGTRGGSILRSGQAAAADVSRR